MFLWQFSHVDVGAIDRSDKLKMELQEALLKVKEAENAELRTFEHSQKALNHAAKRGLRCEARNGDGILRAASLIPPMYSNVYLEVKDLVSCPDIPAGVANMAHRLIATCTTSLDICQSVELQRRLLLGDYSPSQEDVVMSEFFQALGYNAYAADKLVLTNDCGPDVFSCCVEVMRPAGVIQTQSP